jgi:hypothetical protein
MNCRGCGVELDPSEEQVNAAVDQILDTSLKHAEKTGGVCPLCGHSKDVPYSQKKSVLFALLTACLVLLGIGALAVRQWRERSEKALSARRSPARAATRMLSGLLAGSPQTNCDLDRAQKWAHFRGHPITPGRAPARTSHSDDDGCATTSPVLFRIFGLLTRGL